jgi:hypothetical protein
MVARPAGFEGCIKVGEREGQGLSQHCFRAVQARHPEGTRPGLDRTRLLFSEACGPRNPQLERLGRSPAGFEGLMCHEINIL